MFITPDELKKQLITPRALYYNTGKFSFRSHIYINSAYNFYNLKDTQTTPKGTAKSFIIEIQSSGGSPVGSVTLPAGWVGSIHAAWTHLPRGRSYKIIYKNPHGYNYLNEFTNVSVTYN